MYEAACDTVSRVNSVLWGPATLAFFLITGLYLSVRTGFFQLTGVRSWFNETLVALFRKKNVRESRDSSSVSQFQAICASLAACVGTGNIVGVATAIYCGGAGAVFWMWVASFLGMMTCCCENVLGISYRVKCKNGEWLGGPMAYLERGLKSKPFAKLYAGLCTAASFGIGNMTQANSAGESLTECFGVNKSVTGVILCVLTAVVVLGGLKRIAAVTEKLIPFSCIAFLVLSFVCIAVNLRRLPSAFESIFSGAFSLRAAGSAAAGITVRDAIRYGVSRGVFSNEAGLGTSAIIHSTADNDNAAVQGMWGIFEVFADTPVMCTVTALVILCSGVYEPSGTLNGAALTQAAFSQTLGGFGEIFLCVGVCLFAFATIVGWCCYGESTARYLLGDRFAKGYRYIYIVAVFVGAVLKIELVWNVADALNALMAIPNLIGLMALSKKATGVINNYRKEKRSRITAR